MLSSERNDTTPLKKVVVAGTRASFPSVLARGLQRARDRPTFPESLHAQRLFLQRICISHREQPLRFLIRCSYNRGTRAE